MTGVTDRLTFVFTDIEGSTRLLERLQGRYGEVLARHAEIVRELAAGFGGREVDTQGDAFFLVFPEAADAVGFAAELQRRLAAEEWPDEASLLLRIGLHTGQATLQRTGYVGLDVHHGARVAAAGHGGQVLVSAATAADLGDGLSGDMELRSLGSFRLKDIREPVELLQLVGHGLAGDFPQPRSLDERDEPPAPGDPPYPGLAQFEELDEDRFFGRESLVVSIVDRLEHEPFLALIGASGSGKSSLLRAGLIPSVRRRPTEHDEIGERLIVVTTPTEQPVESLERSLDSIGQQPWLVAIDQFEELFTLCREDKERGRFVDRLLELLDTGSHVAITLRADFYDRLAPYGRLRELVSENQEYLGPMSEEELRRAIEGPAAAGGWQFALGLVDLVLHDIGREPGALPLLSHSLRETWQRRRGTQLTLRGYLDSGGVQGGIARTADQTIAELQSNDLALARDIFLRLTELGEDTPDTRRRASLDELVVEQRDPAAARAVLDRLIAARLVVTEGNDAEVAHEALIREWPTLREWLESDRDSLRLHRRLTIASRDWETAARDPSLALRGGRLAQSLEWLVTHEAEASELERTFILTSKRLADAEEAERETQRQRELQAAQRLAETERARAEEQTSAARRLRRRAMVLAGAVGVAAILALVAVVFGLRAAENETLAQARELASAADATLTRDPELSLLLAIRAVERRASPETDRRLRAAAAASLVRFRFEGHQGNVVSVAYRADGEQLVTAGVDGTVRLWDVATRNQVEVFRPENGVPSVAAIAADGTRVATATDVGDVWIWEVGNGRLGTTFHADDDGATDLTFDPSGDRVMTVGFGGSARIWDAATSEELLELDTDPERGMFSAAAAYSPDGSLVVASGPGQRLASLWDARTGRRLMELVGHTDEVHDVAFSADGTRVATAGRDQTARVWDAVTGAQIAVLRGHDADLTSLAFAPNGALVTGSNDGSAAVWDVTTRQRVAALIGHQGPILDVAVTPNGQIVTTAGSDSSVRSWAMAGSPASVTLSGFLAPVNDVSYSPDGSQVLATSSDWTARVFDAESGQELHVLEGHEDGVLTGAFSPDGSRILTAAYDAAPRVWDAVTGKLVLALEGHEAQVRTAAWDPSGRRVVSASDDGTIRIWDASTGDELVSLRADVEAAILSTDGTRIITGDASGSIGIWDWGTGQLERTLAGHIGRVASLALNRDGTRLASASDDGSIRIWRLESGVTELELRGEFSSPHRASFSPDGTRIVSGGDDGAAHVWDAASGSVLAAIRSDPQDVFAATFAPDGRHLVFANRRSTATIHMCDLCGSTEEVLEIARGRVTRDLSAEERASFLHETVTDAPPSSVPSASATASLPDLPPAAEPPMAGDICRIGFGPCELAPGMFHPTRFQPPIAFSLSEPAVAIGQHQWSVAIDAAGGEITILRGERTFGYEGESAVRIGTRAEDFIDYLRSKPWLTLTPTRSVDVGGHAAIAVDVGTDPGLSEPLDVFFTEPFPFASFAGEQARVVAVDVGETYVVIQGSALDPEAAETFFRTFDAFVESVTFP